MAPRFKEKYRSEVVASLRDEFSYPNVNQVPRLEKIVVNMGVGEAAQDAKALDAAMADMAIITG
ncbi:MAG: 50S ribosomal protein L5, partial [Actinobacteria bacterium HGW-Actinobacteria-9]